MKIRTPGKLFLIAGFAMAFTPFTSAGQNQAQTPRSDEIVSKPGSATEVIEQESLGDLARELKKERATEPRQPVKVYTNQNIPAGDAGLSIVGPPEVSGSEASVQGPRHGEDYYREKMAELEQRLDTDKRELSVMQQHLNVNQLQYYPDPTKALEQQYSRSDIHKGQQDVDAKQKQVVADEQAIRDLEDQLRRDGGEPGWLREGPPATRPGSTATGKTKKAPAPTDAEKKSKDYWQGRFKEARAALKAAQEQEQISENELDLLKRQTALDAAASNAADLQAQVEAKQAEVDTNHAAVDQAQQDLKELEEELQQSGAPAEWSETQ